MSFRIFKKLHYLIATIVVFSVVCFIFSQRINHSHDIGANSLQDAGDDSVSYDKKRHITQNLLQDFEDDFLKQYTPLFGCEDISKESKSATCSLHFEQAKDEFKQEFIQRRGLPKDTFTNLHLSFTN